MGCICVAPTVGAQLRASAGRWNQRVHDATAGELALLAGRLSGSRQQQQSCGGNSKTTARQVLTWISRLGRNLITSGSSSAAHFLGCLHAAACCCAALELHPCQLTAGLAQARAKRQLANDLRLRSRQQA